MCLFIMWGGGGLGLPVFFYVAGGSHFYFFGVLLHGVFFVVFDSFEQSFGILFLLLLLLLLFLLLLSVLLVLLILLVLLLLVLLVLLLLILLVVLTVVAFFVFVLVLVFVVLVLSTVLLLLLLSLLEHFFCVGEVVAGVVVFGGEFEGFLIVVDSLLELLHSVSSVFFLQSCFEVAVAAVVEDVAAFFFGEAGLLECAVVVLDGFVVFLLTVECVAEVVLGTVGGAVAVERAAVVDFGAVVVLRFVFAVAFSGFFAHVAALSRKSQGQCGNKEQEDYVFDSFHCGGMVIDFCGLSIFCRC